MTPEDLSAAVRDCVLSLQGEGALTGDVPEEIVIERPKNRDHGDYATPVALSLAKSAGRPPRDIAAMVAERLRGVPGISEAEIAGPGFINIRLAADAQGSLAGQVVEAGPGYGHGSLLAGRRFNVEFISANPTGPLHLGHTRWAAVGDALARVLAAAGAEVSTEFYINDRGVQMDRFGASVMAVAHGRPVPEDGYHGAYITDLAARVVAERPDIRELPDGEQLIAFREAAYALQLAQQQQVLELFRTHFDTWYSERSLHDSGAVERGMARLREQGHLIDALCGALPELDPARLAGSIEGFVGYAQVPLGVAGPVNIRGLHAVGEHMVPLATTEGTLVASFQHAFNVINRCGGAQAA